MPQGFLITKGSDRSVLRRLNKSGAHLIYPSLISASLAQIFLFYGRDRSTWSGDSNKCAVFSLGKGYPDGAKTFYQALLNDLKMFSIVELID